ncbi:hypothetical protein BV22DRAFT_1130496 [Leucogyrophana mollusca]|uniref:Uncharacterized protein n=1 Tax=Leucogyrophana mollusca TaxID=85980 RepID=A0ACB8BGL3_9AGAM|nr:hypothetical protein BV22DRAFT_1130496 [Leucogyrophana mollusca]
MSVSSRSSAVPSQGMMTYTRTRTEKTTETTTTRTTEVTETITKTTASPRSRATHSQQNSPLIVHLSVQSSIAASPRPSSPALSLSAASTRSSAQSLDAGVDLFPHPDTIELPADGVRPTGFWVITVGQEVGIFYHWDDVAKRTNYISGAIQKKYPSFQEALQHYRTSYDLQLLSAVPVPNGPFSRRNRKSSPVRSLPFSSLSSPARSPASVASPEPNRSSSSTDSDELWSQLDDLSLHMSQASIE